MFARRVGFLAAGGIALACVTVPGSAQVPDEVVINILRECAKIDDPTARLACYDNNIRTGGFDGQRPSVPGQMDAPQGAGAPIASGGRGGFGSESIRSPDRFETPAGEVDEISATVAAIALRQPGVYLITLEGGAQWIFTESVDRFFRAPRPGDSVRIERAALGSFLMQIDKQQGVRVRRVR